MNLTPLIGGTNLCLRTCDHCLARLEGTNPLHLGANIGAPGLPLALDTLLSQGNLESVRFLIYPERF